MDEFVATAPIDERMRLRTRGDPAVHLAQRMADIITLAVARRHADPYWTPDRIADELEKYLPSFDVHVADLARELRAEGRG